MIQTLLQLAGLFGVLSLLAFGGGAGVIPDMQRAAVNTHHWLTAREFLDAFAISRAAPGPGSLIVVLIGQKAAGLAGAAVAFVAMFVPSCLIVFLVARGWHRAAQAPWRATIERGLAPVAVGMTFATGIALMRGTESGLLPWGITVASTAAFAFTEIHPIALLAAGASLLLLVGG
jgi:chromate transporter